MALTQTGTDGIKDDAVTLDKLEHGTSSNNGKFLRANNGAAPSFETISHQSLVYPNGGTAVLTSTNDVVEISGKVNWDNDPNNTYSISFDAPTTLTKDSNYTLPEDGTNGQYLKTNGSGVLSFGTVDLTALSASNLTSGTVPDARFPATLPAASAANLTNIPAANITGTLPAIDGSNLTGLGGGVPSGCILIWSGASNAIPTGWVLCDGNNSTPDLRDRFVVGAGTTYSVNDTGGEATVSLTEAQMPSHVHHVYLATDSSGPYGSIYASGNNNSQGAVATTSKGSGNAHENRPPYYALCYIMKS